MCATVAHHATPVGDGMRLQARIYEPEDGETIELLGTTVRVLCPEANSVGASTFEFSAAPEEAAPIFSWPLFR